MTRTPTISPSEKSQLGLHLHDEFIAEMSSNATKELAIETSLLSIKETWGGLSLDMVPYKEAGRVQASGTEETYAALEDNIVTLSTMKASKFFVVFSTPITPGNASCFSCPRCWIW